MCRTGRSGGKTLPGGVVGGGWGRGAVHTLLLSSSERDLEERPVPFHGVNLSVFVHVGCFRTCTRALRRLGPVRRFAPTPWRRFHDITCPRSHRHGTEERKVMKESFQAEEEKKNNPSCLV